MSNNYLKVGKLYTLGTTAVTAITGASFIHGVYNGSNAAAEVVIDNTHIVHMANDGSVTFPIPLSFSTVKMSSANTTGVILYS
jgi:hypothetical protein